MLPQVTSHVTTSNKPCYIIQKARGDEKQFAERGAIGRRVIPKSEKSPIPSWGVARLLM